MSLSREGYLYSEAKSMVHTSPSVQAGIQLNELLIAWKNKIKRECDVLQIKKYRLFWNSSVT